MNMDDWEDPAWTDDMVSRYASFSNKIEFLLWYIAPGL